MYVIFGCKYIAPHNNYAQLHKLVCCIRIRITTDHRNKSEHASCTLASHVLHMHWTLWDTILLHGKLWSIHGSPFLFPGLKSFDEDKGMPFIRPFIPPPHTPPPPTPSLHLTLLLPPPLSLSAEKNALFFILRSTAYTMPFSTEPGRTRKSHKLAHKKAKTESYSARLVWVTE